MSAPLPRVLVVDDEENVAYLIASALRLAGYETLTAATGTEAVARAATFGPHVVVLDVMLPDIDGYEVLRRVRASGSDAAVLFVTARGATADRVRGLTSGGDDYIVKPFELEELVARVQVAVRRAGVGGSASRLEVADLAMDLDARRVWRGGVEAQLTATEFNLLRVLMANAGRVVAREQILDSVWQYDFNGESSIIESFIRNLRRKVDAAPPKLIHTIRGVGYSIREPS
ncbi:MAG: response regulator transcription factor [Candidatus Nanopelagicales bacterium]|jgi:two-component system OmpR family response regulator|nr:response regulator transcription factor [Candidatus Nanopelagicales bacterium]